MYQKCYTKEKCFCNIIFIHVFVFIFQFAGFSAESLCERIMDSQCCLLITAGKKSMAKKSKVIYSKYINSANPKVNLLSFHLLQKSAVFHIVHKSVD